MKKDYRYRWTSNSREHKIIHMDRAIYDWEDEMKGVCLCPRHKPYWNLKEARRAIKKHQRNWKKYRKTQYKVRE